MSEPRMKRIVGGAALLMGLLAAPQAEAQLLLAEPVLAGIAEDPPRPVDAAPVPESREAVPADGRVRISSRTYTEEDGSRIVRRGLIGSWSIASSLEAGVGLFSVSGSGRKPIEARRGWSVMDVAPRNENIAAVGMKLKF